MLKLSKSKLLDYTKCPRYFYLKYYSIYGRKPEETKPDYVLFGSLLHEYFEAYNKNISDLEYYEQFLMKDEKIAKHIKNFKKILRDFGLSKAVYSELKLYNERLDLVGIIDAIYEKNGKYILVDYKTGKFKRYDMKYYLFELYLYVILVESEMHITIDWIGMFFTSEPEKSFIKRVNGKKRTEVFKKFEELKNKIENGEFERKESRYCNFCEFVFICDKKEVME